MGILSHNPEGGAAMPDQPANQPPATEVQASLHELATVLREGHHLGPETRQALANLLDELSQTSDPAARSTATAQLAQHAAHLARQLHRRQDRTLLTAARDRLEEAVYRAEAESPVAAGIARQLLDALANLGI
jgi:hypothetical protein